MWYFKNLEEMKADHDKDKIGRLADKMSKSKSAKAAFYLAAAAIIPLGPITMHAVNSPDTDVSDTRASTDQGHQAAENYMQYINDLSAANDALSSEGGQNLTDAQAAQDAKNMTTVLKGRMDSTIENILIDTTLSEGEFAQLHTQIIESPLYEQNDGSYPNKLSDIATNSFVDCQNAQGNISDDPKPHSAAAKDIVSCMYNTANPQVIENTNTSFGILFGVFGAMAFLMVGGGAISNRGFNYSWRAESIKREEKWEEHRKYRREEMQLESTSRDNLDAWIGNAVLERPVISDEHNENLVGWLSSDRAKLAVPKV